MAKKSSDDQSDLRIQPDSITSIPSLVRAEWLKCWGCQDLLWVILELRVTKPHSWTHRHISPGFMSRQVLREGTDGLVQFSSGSTEYRGIPGQGTLRGTEERPEEGHGAVCWRALSNVQQRSRISQGSGEGSTPASPVHNQEH